MARLDLLDAEWSDSNVVAGQIGDLGENVIAIPPRGVSLGSLRGPPTTLGPRFLFGNLKCWDTSPRDEDLPHPALSISCLHA